MEQGGAMDGLWEPFWGLGSFTGMVFGGLLGPLGAPGAPLGLPGEPFEGFGVQGFSKSFKCFQSLLPHALPGGPKA